ncbi:class I SAM-dependent methyltransferase [Breznakiella homolactica]|uniref:Methyltransferase domain-containing protein n=1 Tax=Breznakiella homolactica TaxID=2798577 RepID=A0A7T7XK92_9SPIR|nr:methyltransferase domain-containing protein [Breznakiella homolactica]QQO07747.1 methyltransferase domain-containing protein [Breznakiella homolactica]
MDETQKRTIASYDKTAGAFAGTIGAIGNYDETYDCLIEKIPDNGEVLELACGPAQISAYIAGKIPVRITGVDLSGEMLKIARTVLPEGDFVQASIVDYRTEKRFDTVILGFGLPYLKKEEVRQCIKNSAELLKGGGHIYISFMEGETEGFEKTSFGGDNEFYIRYHKKNDVTALLRENRLMLIRDFTLDYTEPDGSVTKDSILIARKEL